MQAQRMMLWCSCLVTSLLFTATARAQDGEGAVALRAHVLSLKSDPADGHHPTVALDGSHDEPAWRAADSIVNLVTTEPEEGAVPAGQTIVKVLVNPTEIIIGVVCRDTNPDRK